MKAWWEMYIGYALVAAHKMRTREQGLNQVTLAVEQTSQ